MNWEEIATARMREIQRLRTEISNLEIEIEKIKMDLEVGADVKSHGEVYADVTGIINAVGKEHANVIWTTSWDGEGYRAKINLKDLHLIDNNGNKI